MHSRVDPRLASLPETLQDLIRSNRYYRFPSSMGLPRVYISELMTTALESLVRAGVANPTDVLEALRAPQLHVREAARSLVGWLQWRKAAPSLLRQFQEMAEERESIGRTLAKLHSRRARKRLLKWMTTSTDAEFRWQAALSLFDDSDVSLVGPFLGVVNNEAETNKIRRLAIEAVSVCLFGQDRRSRLWRDSTQALIPYLEHPDWEFRWEAAFALGQANARKVLPRLRQMAENDHEIEKNNTCWSLAEIISWLE